jgi:hypothetical protein
MLLFSRMRFTIMAERTGALPFKMKGGYNETTTVFLSTFKMLMKERNFFINYVATFNNKVNNCVHNRSQ